MLEDYFEQDDGNLDMCPNPDICLKVRSKSWSRHFLLFLGSINSNLLQSQSQKRDLNSNPNIPEKKYFNPDHKIWRSNT